MDKVIVKPFSVQLTVMDYAFPWEEHYLGMLLGSVSESHRPHRTNIFRNDNADYQLLPCCMAPIWGTSPKKRENLLQVRLG